MKIQILTELEIESKEDLYKIGNVIDDIKEVNCSEIGRRLGMDRRTVNKNILGKTKKTRNKPSMFDDYIDLIISVLTNEMKVFASKAALFRYLQEQHGLSGKDFWKVMKGSNHMLNVLIGRITMKGNLR